MSNRIMPVPVEMRKFEEGIAELIRLLSTTSCIGKEVFLKELVALATTRLEVRESEGMDDDSAHERMDDDSAHDGLKDSYISVMFDGERNHLTVEDSGVGMTKDHLIYLGTKAKQSTKALILAIEAGKDISERKLFEVGFFTVFAVADKVTIKSKDNEGTKWYIWESAAPWDGITIQHIQNQELKCRTQITLHLKTDVAENIRSTGLEKFLREHNCRSSYKINVHQHTVIYSSEDEESIGPQKKAAVVTKDLPKLTENIPGTSQGSTNSDKSDNEREESVPLDVPVTPAATNGIQNHVGKSTETPSRDRTSLGGSARKTPGSAQTPSTSKTSISTLMSVKNCINANVIIAVKVMKQTEEGKAKPKPGKPWHRGSYEIVDSTDRAILRVYGPQEMSFFKPRQLILLHKVWIRKDHIAFTKHSRVEEYKEEIKTVEDINKKRRSDEAKNRMTLEKIKENAGCEAAANLHISQVGKALQYKKSAGQKGLFKKLQVKDRKNSKKAYELVTFDKVAEMSFENEGRYHFPCITYNPDKENFQIVGETLPQLV